MVSVPTPPQPIATAGGLTAVYELRLVNSGSGVLRFAELQVLDDGGRSLIVFDETALAARFESIVSRAPGMLPTGQGILYLEVPLSKDVRAVQHRLHYFEPGTARRLRTPLLPLSRTAVPHLAPPLRDGPWVAVHAPEWPRGHRRVIYTTDRPRIPGRLAIDFVRVDEAGRIARGDADVPSNALGYGADVLAVADARVAAVRDGMAESPSVERNPAHAPGDAAGNFVSLDLGGGRFAIYEHLKPGSIKVKTGDGVKRGEVIAALGFTGDTTGPHLHFHVADAPMPLLGEGTGFVFAGYEQLGSYADLGMLGSKRWVAAPNDGPRVGERPASNTVIRF